MATLEADGIWLAFGERKILQSIYLRMDTGQVLGLLGRNGCGKSCLLQTVFGTLRAENQSVRIDGKFIEYPYQKARLIRYLPQHSFVPLSLKIKDAFEMYQVDFEPITTRFESLKKYKNSIFRELSGGEKRLLETLLILLSPVQFVLLDEPFSGVSPVWIEEIKKLIVEQKSQKGILISDHQYGHVLNLSDHIYLLQTGGSLYRLSNPETELRDRGYLR